MTIERKLERIMKGGANHRRIQMLRLLERQPGLAEFVIADELDANLKTISVHLQRLAHAGLVEKRYVGKRVAHTASPLGKHLLKFLRTLD